MTDLVAKLIRDEYRLPLGIFPKKPPRPLRLDEIPEAPPRPTNVKRLDEI